MVATGKGGGSKGGEKRTPPPIRIIGDPRFKEFKQAHRSAAGALDEWYKKADGATWRAFADVRQTRADADQVVVKSGRPVVVFNIGSLRLITAIHYNTGVCYLLRFLTHAEYDKEKWKAQL